MKSVLLCIVMSCMTISLSGQWKPGYPGEDGLFKVERQKPFSVDTNLGLLSGKHAKQFQDDTYSNSVRQYAITHQLDSVIYEGVSENTSQWVGSFRSIFQYNPEEKLQGETVEIFNEFLQTWENADKYFYVYNKNQQLVLDSSLMWDTDNGMWTNKSKTKYAYNPSMQLISRTRYYWDEEFNIWYASSKTAYTYNPLHLLESEIYASWSETDLWVEMYRDEYAYDADSILIAFTTSQKYNPHDPWRYIDKTVYEYDSLGQLSNEYNYNFLDSGDWGLYARKGNSYDPQGNIVEELTESWNSTGNFWSPSYLDQYTFEEGLATSYFSYNWNYVDQSWEGWYGGTAAYTIYGDIAQRVDLRWDESLMDWAMINKAEYDYDLSVDFANVLWPYPDADPSDLFHRMPINIQLYGYEGDWKLENSVLLRYSFRTSTSSSTIEPLTLSPNPVHDFIQFSVPDIQDSPTLRVYSSEGKLMISTSTIENTQISTSSLSPGWYIATIQNGKDLYIGKFVKE